MWCSLSIGATPAAFPGGAFPGSTSWRKSSRPWRRQARRPPKIGMFFDTSTSLTVANGGAAPDLTTAAGKGLFYSFIHTFFANVPQQFWAMIDGRPIVVLYGGGSAFIKGYDQSTFDYVAQQFRQDFGTTPYVIRHYSWLGVTTDAEYAGWPTSFHATFAGDVASVAPGEDNYAVIATEKKIVTDRNCGDLYQADWDQVVAHGARWRSSRTGTSCSKAPVSQPRRSTAGGISTRRRRMWRVGSHRRTHRHTRLLPQSGPAWVRYSTPQAYLRPSTSAAPPGRRLR